MLQCVYLSLADSERLNTIMFNNFMFDGENYIWPFSEGTQYIDSEYVPVIVDEYMFANMQTFVNDIHQTIDDIQFIQNIINNLQEYIPPTD